MKESYFDGGILDYIGYFILAALISLLTFGIATSWAVCMIQNWKTKHTVVVNVYTLTGLEHNCSVTGLSGFF